MGTSPSVVTENFLSRLDGVRQTSSGWVARCPCRNDDQNPSLSIGQGDDGRTLVTCHRGLPCSVSEICDSVGLRVSDLMPQNYSQDRTHIKPRPVHVDNGKSSSPQNKYEKPAKKPEFVESYDYTDENGKLLFQKVRYIDEDGKKTFRQRKPDGSGGWVYSLGDTPKVLYNLPSVLAAKANNTVIWVVEGEKDANTLIEMGEVATTMPGGAGKWLDIHTETLAGAVVEIIADRDEVGMAHAKNVLEKLSAAGCNAQAWVCPSAKDITDHIQAGRPIDEIMPLDGEIKPKITESNSELELSPEDQTIRRLLDIVSREDMNAKQKIAKSTLLLNTATISHVLDSGRLVQWNEFINESEEDSYQWVIPGLLEKSERVIVVAAEGVGKTMLARQVGILCSAGLHPFTFQRIPRVRTLSVDLENPERIIRRTSRPIAIQAMRVAGTSNIDAYILSKPSGMDLLRAQDRLILEEAIEEVKPEMLILGPLYKSFIDPGGRTSESVAIEVAKYLDTIRTVYGCALWLEHHAPLGSSSTTRDLRPFGSAVWSRWPEFGLSLQPDPTSLGEYVYDVRHFRGARDERQWPSKIKRGKQFPFEVIDYSEVSHERGKIQTDY